MGRVYRVTRIAALSILGAGNTGQGLEQIALFARILAPGLLLHAGIGLRTSSDLSGELKSDRLRFLPLSYKPRQSSIVGAYTRHLPQHPRNLSKVETSRI